MVRAALGLPFLGFAIYLVRLDGIAFTLLAILPLLVGLSLPAAALVQEPD
ncbi:MAG: hypothetical protein HYT87_08635 [Nitrospirae bacterium]|nr:hypothetical protein [Nitrospirota bacterium]